MMMKSRLSALVSTLCSGKQRRSSPKEILIVPSYMNFLNGECRNFSSFQNQHFEAPRRAVINSHSEDDFSELGPPVVESADSQLKLVTQKLEPSLKTAPAGRALVSRSSLHSQYQASKALRRTVHNFTSEEDFSELGAPVAWSSVTQLKLVTEKPEPFAKTDPTGKASPDKRRLTELFSVDKTSQNSDGNFHINHNVNQKNSLKVDSSSCSMLNENVLDDLHCCNIDSENSESCWRDLPNIPFHGVKNVRIRILGIAEKTTDPMIHSICKSTGVLEGFARVDRDSVDALFRVTNGTDAEGIVQRLNDTIIDNCHWSAYEIPQDLSSTTLPVSEEVRSKLGIQVNTKLTELKRQFDSKKIYLEDFQLLHMGIMHLEGLPTSSNALPDD